MRLCCDKLQAAAAELPGSAKFTPVEFGHDFIRATESVRIIGRSALHFARACSHRDENLDGRCKSSRVARRLLSAVVAVKVAAIARGVRQRSKMREMRVRDEQDLRLPSQLFTEKDGCLEVWRFSRQPCERNAYSK